MQFYAGRPVEAMATGRRAEGLLGALASEFPEVPEYRDDLARCLENRFRELRQAGRLEEAEQVGGRLVELRERLFREQPTLPDHRDRLSGALLLLADMHSVWPEGRYADPARALELARRAVAIKPEDMTRQSLGWALYRVGDWKGCIGALEKTQGYSRGGDVFAAMAHWRLGDEAVARAMFDRSVESTRVYEARWTPDTYPEPAMCRRMLAEAAALLGVGRPGGEAKPGPVPDATGPPGSTGATG